MICDMPWNKKMTSRNIKAHIVDAIGGGICPKHGEFFGHGRYGLRACPFCDIDEYYKRKAEEDSCY